MQRYIKCFKISGNAIRTVIDKNLLRMSGDFFLVTLNESLSISHTALHGIKLHYMI